MIGHHGATYDEDTVRSLTILNLSGDSTLIWAPENDALMEGVIGERMRNGFAFFVMRRRWGGLLPDRKVRVTDLAKAMESRKLTMADEVFAGIVGQGGVQLVRTPAQRSGLGTGDAQLTRVPALAAASQCLVVRQPVGG